MASAAGPLLAGALTWISAPLALMVGGIGAVSVFKRSTSTNVNSNVLVSVATVAFRLAMFADGEPDDGCNGDLDAGPDVAGVIMRFEVGTAFIQTR